MEKKYAETPLMKQYYSIKAQYPDALLLFRAGDFYETFGDDAEIASRVLGITLTKRANGSAATVPLAGFPHHAVDNYMPKLVTAGYRVAICEQLEDPKKAKGIVKRGVVELVTPGVSYHDNVLQYKENSYLAAISFGKGGRAGVAILDVSTGEFYASEGKLDYIEKLISNFSPKEIVYKRSDNEQYKELFGDRYFTYRLDDWAFNETSAREKLVKQLDVQSLKGFGVESMVLAVTAAGAVLYYLEYTVHTELGHINSISRLDSDKYVWVDRYSIRNLELFYPLSEGGVSLTDVLDRTACPMGARMLRRWISLPLRDAQKIGERHDVVSKLLNNIELQNALIDNLTEVGDLERIIGKVAAGRVNPREVVQLAKSLTNSANIKSLCSEIETAKRIADLGEVVERIGKVVLPEPALQPGKGSIIAYEVDKELDELRRISSHGKDFLLEIQQREIERTGITSLKISYNSVFGYYIEVRNAHKDKVPTEWIRKQTLVNAERYITQELKDYEEKILGAEGRITEIEARIFAELVVWLQGSVAQAKQTANAIAEIDTLCSFARVAKENRYCRPVMSDTDVIDIKDGRHPVIETRLPIGEPYIPNDVYLDSQNQQIIIITGPNMAGKSALLRQTALIVLMAQIGCYVPAREANIGVVDRIFTRVGASDNISQGESTFMVEMLESANILNNISGSSLVLLDEIGRGTSTYDGISIAWAMVEYLHSKPAARTMFATHYHELNEMENQFERIRNYNVSVREVEKRVIFLRKLVRGGTEHSFGIHVAKMAGMPNSVVDRAKRVLAELEKQRTGKVDVAIATEKPIQLSFIQLEDPTIMSIKKQIKGLDVNNLTPIEALNKLDEIKKILG
ncbi:DNA mismatch repair protein MutS [Mucinivorans hirudinis]|uniref:DNA mismatch repair protein MutS n=1 Tax=Mucinivorans hirudinis TaxID=1433126 RepID=A0A060R5U3_9BACT|nr:DNA mismatch repair protein MutS [Mucinivorans hirudinis]